MRINKLAGMICVAAAVMFVLTGTGFAQSVKERMQQRLPVIAKLKSQGIVGENNRGYLGFVGAKKIRQDLVNAENKDRKAIYMQIAKEYKTQLGVVEKNRAQQLAKRAAKGTYIMDAGGQWVKK